MADVVVIREWLMLSNPERGMQEEVFLLPSEELFSRYVEAATGIKDAVATGERYVDDTDTIIMRAYPAVYPSAIQNFRKDGEETRVPIVQPDGYIEGWWVTDNQD